MNESQRDGRVTERWGTGMKIRGRETPTSAKMVCSSSPKGYAAPRHINASSTRFKTRTKRRSALDAFHYCRVPASRETTASMCSGRPRAQKCKNLWQSRALRPQPFRDLLLTCRWAARAMRAFVNYASSH
eukprot:1213919-Pleurochrysis_carterae.AAC.1